MWTIFLSALALVFVIEGILPFLCPDCWRRLMQKAALQQDKALRLMGFISMLVGVSILFVLHHHLF